MSSDLPWFSEYKTLGIPKTYAPYPDEPVYAILEKTAKKYPERGLIQGDTRVNYPLLLDHAARLAKGLTDLGLSKGDRVATLLPTSISFVVADYGISMAGLVHMPASFLEPGETLVHKFRKGQPGALICLAGYADPARKILRDSGIDHLILSDMDEFSDTPGEFALQKGEIRLLHLIRQSSGELPYPGINPDADLETLLFTGGTTGLPKGCMLTHKNIYANAIQSLGGFGAAARLTLGGMAVLLGVPFFHSYGHMAMHTMTLAGYDQILIPDARDTDAMVQMIKDHAPVIQIGVPTQFMKLSETGADDGGMMGLSGSAPLPENTQKRYEKRSSGGIMEAYGLSEMSPATHMNTSFLIRLFGGRKMVKIINSCLSFPGVVPIANFVIRKMGAKCFGRVYKKNMKFLVKITGGKKKEKGLEKRKTVGIPFPDTKVKLVDVETGKTLTPQEIREGKTGEMRLDGPQRMQGYWPDPGSGLDSEGYVSTGDVVRVDENGYFYVVDRTKDMIIVSGFKVYSRELEEIVYSHPATDIAAVVGIPDPEREGSERVALFIQPRSEYVGKVTEDEIKAYVKEQVPGYAVPKVVVFVDAIPVTGVGKVDKKALRKEITRQPQNTPGSRQDTG